MLAKLTRVARQEILDTLAQAGRANSDATVLFHATMAERLGLNPTDYKVMSILERLGHSAQARSPSIPAWPPPPT